MFPAQRALLFGFFLMAGPLCLPFLGGALSSTSDDGLRIDVPPGARVRIENQFGQVTAEVWKEKYVSVSAFIEGTGGPIYTITDRYREQSKACF